MDRVMVAVAGLIACAVAAAPAFAQGFRAGPIGGDAQTAPKAATPAQQPAQQPSGQPPTVAPPLPPSLLLKSEGVAGPRIFTPPPVRWDSAMNTGLQAFNQGRSDFIAITDGFAFGLQPPEVNGLLPKPIAGLRWLSLPPAPEFPGDVRYFWLPLNDVGALKMGTEACVGASSYLVFLFTTRGLARLSYRLVPDAACPSVSQAARDIYAKFVTLGPALAYSVHYRTGSADVVDVTDPNAGFMVPIHWYQTGR